MGPIVLFETSGVRLIEYLRYRDSTVVYDKYLFLSFYFVFIVVLPPNVVVEDRCALGTPIVPCRKNPCFQATCRGYANAKCRVNLCGTCKAVFYVGGRRVSCGMF